MWYKNLHEGWRRAKGFIHQNYTRLHKWAGEADRVANITKRAFALAAPILDEFGQGNAIGQGMRAIQGYDNLRQNVMSADEKARRLVRPVADADIFY